MKGLMILNSNCEDVEALGTRALLRRAGFHVDTVTTTESKSIKTAFGLSLEADFLLKDINEKDYQFLVIPGGRYVHETIDYDLKIQEIAIRFASSNRLIAAICAGPRFLGRAGLLDAKNFTAYPGSEKDIPKGFYQPEEKAVTDGNFITARGAGAIYEFSYHIVKKLFSEKEAKALFENIRY